MDQVKWPSDGKIILPLCPFPSLFYFKCLAKEAIIDPYENYVKQSFRNRYEVLSSQGKLTLQVPVTGQKGQKTPTQDIEIFTQAWQRRHLQSIRTSYGSAPFFIHYFDDLEILLAKKYTSLGEYSNACLELCSHWLALPLPQYSSNYIEAEQDDLDLRPFFKPGRMPIDKTRYTQIFADRMEFVAGLSVLDAIMHLGPEAASDF